MQANQFSLIFDQLYTEKHNLFTAKVIKWQETKQQFLNETYQKTIDFYFAQMDSQNKSFEKLIHQLLKVTNAQYQTLTKVKPVSQDKDLPKNKQPLPAPVQKSLSPQFQQLFITAIQKSHKKASLIHQFCQFAARFFAITSIQLNEFKSMQSQIQNRRQRYLFDFKKELSEEGKISQELYVMNEAKYFNVKNYEKLREALERQVKILAQAHEHGRMYYRQSLDKRKGILKDCVDNMTRFEQLYGKVFSGKILQEIQAHFEKLVEEITKQEEKFAQDQKKFQQSKVQVKKRLQQLLSDNIKIFNFVMEQITLGQWRHIQLQTTKKSSFTSFSSISFSSSNHALRQQTSYQSSEFHIQIPIGGKQTRVQNNFGFVLTITVDYKLIFRKQTEKSRVYQELIMNDLKVKVQKDKKVSDLRSLMLKDKKTKKLIELTFPDCNRKEEFILHLDRFEQLKKSFNK